MYSSTLKRQAASTHTQVCRDTTHTYIDSKCPKDNVTHLIAAAVFALSCVCVCVCLTDRRSLCSDTYCRIPVRSHYGVCVCWFVCVSLFCVYMSVCDCRNLPDFMILATLVSRRLQLEREQNSERWNNADLFLLYNNLYFCSYLH